MDPRPTFNLDELDPETRTLAEEAARREGISPEAWIQQVVIRRLATATEPAPPEPVQEPEPEPKPEPEPGPEPYVEDEIAEPEVDSFGPEPSADDKVVADALDGLATRISASEQNIDLLLNPLDRAVRDLEHQLEALEQGVASGVPKGTASEVLSRETSPGQAPLPKAAPGLAPVETKELAPSPATEPPRRVETGPVERDEPNSRDQTRSIEADLHARLESINTQMQESEEVDPVRRAPETEPAHEVQFEGDSVESWHAEGDARVKNFDQATDPIASLRSAAAHDTTTDGGVLELEDRVERPGTSMRITRAVLLFIILTAALAIGAWLYFRGADMTGVIDQLEQLTKDPLSIFQRGTPPE